MKKHLGTFILVLQGIGLLIVLALFFSGYLYIRKGDPLLSIVLSLILMVVLAVLVFVMAGAKERKNNKGFTLIEGICLLGYAGIAWWAFAPMAHYVNVNFLLKEGIQEMGRGKLNEVDDMVREYESQVQGLNDRLGTEIDTEISQYRSTGSKYPLRERLLEFGINLTDPADAETKKEKNLEANIQAATLGLENIKRDNAKALKEYKADLESWDQFKIHNIFEKIDKLLKKNEATLKDRFKVPNNNKWNEHNFEFTLSQAQGDQLWNTEALKQQPGFRFDLPFGIALFAHLLILLPYLATGRHGIRRIYPSQKGMDNGGGIEM